METSRSFKGYGKVDGQKDDGEYKRKACKRLIIIIISSIFLVSVVIGVVLGTLILKPHNNNSSSNQLNSSAALTSACSQTQYPDSCFTSISKYEVAHNSSTTNPIQIFKFSLLIAMDELISFVNYTQQLASQVTNPLEQQAFTICYEMLDDAIDGLNDSIAVLDDEGGSNVLPTIKIDNLRSLLSTVIVDQETCLDTLAEVNSSHQGDMKIAMHNSTEFTSNTLAILTKVRPTTNGQ